VTWKEIVALAVESISCPRCLQGPGSRCITKGGLWARYQHDARTRPIQKAWLAGLEEGQNEMLDAYDDNGSYFMRRALRRREEREATP
jgi:hypothetical protein